MIQEVDERQRQLRTANDDYKRATTTTYFELGMYFFFVTFYFTNIYFTYRQLDASATTYTRQTPTPHHHLDTSSNVAPTVVPRHVYLRVVQTLRRPTKTKRA
jgi:hypothetical protein